jgi:2-haloacid dehalogenase
MSFLRPKFITFDCYGTLTNFHMGTMTRELFADRVKPEQMDQFVKDFSAYRLDQVMGDWQPYDVILKTALARTCKRWGVEYRDEGQLYYDAVPTWGPHADVPAGLSKIADKIPLVIFSNASDSQIMSNVDKLGAPFHRSSPLNRRKPISHVWRRSSSCSTTSAVARRTSCMCRRASVTT